MEINAIYIDIGNSNARRARRARHAAIQGYRGDHRDQSRALALRGSLGNLVLTRLLGRTSPIQVTPSAAVAATSDQIRA